MIAVLIHVCVEDTELMGVQSEKKTLMKHPNEHKHFIQMSVSLEKGLFFLCWPPLPFK